jgi:hypothetical protein
MDTLGGSRMKQQPIASNTEIDKFNTIKNNFTLMFLKCNKKKALDDLVGDVLEKLTALALNRLRYRTKRWKSRGIDLIATNQFNPAKKLAIECTNWNMQSKTHPNYFSDKLTALTNYHNTGYVPFWIMSYKANFPNLQSNVSVNLIHIIELQKQLLPQKVIFNDYKQLKSLIKNELKII